MWHWTAFKTLILLNLAFFLAGPSLAMGEESAPAREEASAEPAREDAPRPLRVGFVDMEIVLDSSRSIRSIVGEMDEELDEETREIESMRREVRRIQLTLEQQGTVLSDSERAARQQRAIELMDNIEEREYRLERKFREQQRTVIGPLLEQIVRVVGDVSVREDFDLVVRGEMVLYGRHTADLTDKVVEELDQREADLRRALGQAADEPPDEVETPLHETLPLIP